MENKEIVFVGRMQNKTRDYIHCLEREVRLLEQENNQLKEQLEKKYEKTGTLTTEILYEENTKLQSVLKELRSWLEAIKTMYENEYKDVDAAEHYKSVLSKLNELEEGKNENI